MKNTRVFISYSSKDRKVAETVQQKLESAGFDVWRDQARLETDWSREIAFALAGADVLCLLWTEHSAQSRWVKHEWLTARALEKRILILRFPNSPKFPEPLRNLHGISFKRINKGCNELIERLKGETSFTEKYDYSILPENSYIPFNPDPHFTGRHTDLVDLYLKMIGGLNKIGINQVGAVGMGGIGKTLLAIEFAHRFSFAFNGIHWIQAANTSQWLSQFISLARDRLQLSIPDPDSPEASKQYIFGLQKYFREHTNTLVIMDNVADPRYLRSESFLFGLTPSTLGCDLLFTTRRHFMLPGIISQQVDTLSPESALTLLTHSRKPETPEEEEHAKAICNTVGYLPLALTLAAGYLAKYRTASFAYYHAELLKNKLDTIDIGAISAKELATRHVAAVRITLQSQWATLTDKGAQRLFKLAGLFPETAIIPKARLGLLAGIGPGKSKLDQPLEKAFILLHELNLVEELGTDASAIRLHALVRDFALRLIPAKQRASFRRRAAKNLKVAYDDFFRLENEFLARGVNEIIEDLEVGIDWWEKEDQRLRELELLQSALRLSVNQLSEDPNQLTGHLLGRLMSEEADGIRSRLEVAAKAKRGPWLRLLSPSLPQAGGPLLRTLEGHSGWVEAVAVTPDGKAVVSASDDKTLKVWDLQSGEVIQTLKGHSDWVEAVALTPDGKAAVSASRDDTLKVWDLQSGEVIQTLEGHSDWVEAVAVTPDGKAAVSASRDDTLKVWDLQSGEVIQTLEGHNDGVEAVALTPDGKAAVSASRDDTLKVWDLQSGEVIQTLEGHSHCVEAVAITPDGKNAVSASLDKTMKVWDLQSGKVIQTLVGHSYGVEAVAITPDGKAAVSASVDETLKVWDLQSGEVIQTLEGHSDVVEAVAITPDGKNAISASLDKTMKVWDLQSGKVFQTLVGHSHGVEAVAVTPDGKAAVSASRDVTLKVWDLQSGEVIQTLVGHSHWVKAVAVTPDGKNAVSASLDKTLKVWDLQSGEVIQTLVGHSYWVESVAVTPDGKNAVSASLDKTLKVWDLQSGEVIQTLEDRHLVKAVALTPDGKAAVSASGDDTLKVWDLQSGEVIQTLEGHSDWVEAVAVTPDGKAAVSASRDDTLKVWDLQSGEVIQTLEGHSGWVIAVAITPDGKAAVSASSDQTLRVWDLQSGIELTAFIGDYGMKSCSVAPDGKTIVAGDYFGRVHLLRLEGVD